MSDITIARGTDSGIAWPIYKRFYDLPFNFSGYTIKAQARTLRGDVLVYEWNTEDETILIRDNYVIMIWDHATTSAWRWDEAVYSIEMTSPAGAVYQIDRGFINVSREVTR